MFKYKLVEIMPKILHLNFKGHSLWQSLGEKMEYTVVSVDLFHIKNVCNLQSKHLQCMYSGWFTVVCILVRIQPF